MIFLSVHGVISSEWVNFYILIIGYINLQYDYMSIMQKHYSKQQLKAKYEKTDIM
jgi:hypothetical protein